MIKVLSIVISFISVPAVQAEYNSDFGGWTEIIACPISGWRISSFYHQPLYWGASGPNISYTSPSGWWDYGNETDSAFNCGSWINGIVAGGASYEPGKASVPQGVNVRISSNWWDFTHTDFSANCGHQHISSYVWGWRRNANSWSFEFVAAHTLTSYLDDDGICKFKGKGNPNYSLESLEGFAFGDETILIEDSPYAVLYTKSQANSHYGAGCGKQECLHALRIAATYEGGPDVDDKKLKFDASADITLSQVFSPIAEPFVADLHRKEGHLSMGDRVNVMASWKELAYAAENRLMTAGNVNGISKILPLDELTLDEALMINPVLACEISYIQTAGAVAESPPDLDMGEFPLLKMASYDAYVGDCLNLPAEVQKCQVFEYIQGHYVECQLARGEYGAQLKMQASLQPKN